jgi:hypothetical protein
MGFFLDDVCKLGWVFILKGVVRSGYPTPLRALIYLTSARLRYSTGRGLRLTTLLSYLNAPPQLYSNARLSPDQKLHAQNDKGIEQESALYT